MTDESILYIFKFPKVYTLIVAFIPHNEVSLTFNRPNPYSYFKKGSDSVDFYCNVVKFKISKIA